MKIRMTILLVIFIVYLSSCDKSDSTASSQVKTPGQQVSDIVFSETLNAIEDCVSAGGMSNETGYKMWCWGDTAIPLYMDKTGIDFSNGELTIDSECYEKQVTNFGNLLKFRIDPTDPVVESWCSRNYNMRAEIRTNPWGVRHDSGTEEWFGWPYIFGKTYIPDQNNEWLFFQVHNGIEGESPQVEILIIKDGQFGGHDAGELYIVNAANDEYQPTGIIPKAGDRLDIVVHVVWGDSSNGLLQVWINGQSVYDKQVATVYDAYPWGGNAKWGIYKWPWAEESGVQKSLQQGITYLETFMGPLRAITRKFGDTDYLKNSYPEVVPR